MYRSMSYGKISRKAVYRPVTDATFAGIARVSSGSWLCKNADLSLIEAILCLGRPNRPEISRRMTLMLYK